MYLSIDTRDSSSPNADTFLSVLQSPLSAASGERLIIQLPRLHVIDGPSVKLGSVSDCHPSCIEQKAESLRGEEGGRTVVLYIARSALNRMATEILQAPIEERITFLPHIDLGTGTGALLAQLVASMAVSCERARCLQQHPVVASGLCDAILRLLVEALPNSLSNTVKAARTGDCPRAVTRAIAYMQAHAGEALTLSSIAGAAKISVRGLQQGFRDSTGTTPTAYLRRIRLDRIHRELSDPDNDDCVRDVARRWGFRHLGQFASHYNRLFGCLPSQTRKARSGSSRTPE